MTPKIRVLYAEDTETDADLTKTYFEINAPDFEIEVVSTGQQCLSRLAEDTYDILLLDNRLPDMDGIEVLKELTVKQLHLPVVMVTGAGDETLVVQVLHLGACDYVPKRGNYLKNLPAILRSALTEFRQLREERRTSGGRNRRVLYVECNQADVDLTLTHFAEMAPHIRLEATSSSTDALRLLGEGHFDLVLVDLRMPDMNALDLLSEAKHRGMNIPFIVITGKGDEDAALAALKLGAYDYIVKQGDYIVQLPYALEHAMARAQLKEKNEHLQQELEQRIRAEAEISRLLSEAVDQRHRLDELIESVPGLVWEAWGAPGDLGHKVNFVSNHIEQMLGYSVDEWMSTPNFFLDVVHPDDRERVAREAAEVFNSGKGGGSQYRWIAKDGHVVWVEVRTTITCDEHGKPVGMRGVTMDITERKEAEQARAHLEDQLRQSQKMESIGRLAGGVAHDFNNLLNVIIGYASLIEERAVSGTLQQETKEILGAAERAASLTKQMLAFSRKQILRPETKDLNEIIGGISSMLQRMIGEDIEVLLQPSHDLSPVVIDAIQFEQVIMNLAVNARDAMPHGGRLVITTSNVNLDEKEARALELLPGRYALMTVADDGHGMSAETQARIFEPFYTTKEIGKGTGLGLSTVYGIVSQSGGHIALESKVGEGTKFRIYLPASNEPAVRPTTPTVLTPAETCAATILLTEDEDSLRTLTKLLLETDGYTVLQAASGAEALETAAAYDGPIELLITDIVMPGMHGRELAMRLQIQRPDIKVIYSTGYADSDLILDVHSLVIEKPFSPETLSRTIRRVLVGTSNETLPKTG